jgi:hypothetical protein
MQIRQVPVRSFHADSRSISHIFFTRRSLRVCIAGENDVRMYQIEVRSKVVSVHMRVEVELHLFLTPALGGGQWTGSLTGRSKPVNVPSFPFNMRLWRLQ